MGELGEIMTGSTPSTSKSEYYSEDYSEDGIPWVTPTDINSQTISDTPRKLSEEGIKVGRVVPANTILCTCIASIGKNTLLTVKGSFNQQINCLTPNEYNDAYFLLTESEIWSNIMKRMATAGTMQIVNKTEFSELTTMVPKLEEQKKIGQYFHTIDHLITLHQREFKYVYRRFIINKYKYISENYICIYTKIYGGLKMNNKLELYHGSGQIVEFPEIRKTRYTKDFSWGFYCTKSYEQAYRWAERKHENGIVNVYSYIENSELNIKKFDGMCEEWLDFIAECRAGKTHPYDIVEGPMADDTIWNFVNDYLNKNISKEVFWEYARFKHPSHQISFHSIRALECLKYERSIAVENDTVE